MKIILQLTVAFSLFINAACVFAETAPTSHFSNLPRYKQLSMSPSGNRVAYILNHPTDGHAYLSVYDFDKRKTHYLVKTDNSSIKLNWFLWANDKTILFSAKYATKSQVSAASFAKIFKTRLQAIEFDGDGGAREVFKVRRKEHAPQYVDNIISMLPDDPDHILLATDVDFPNQPSVFKVNLYTKKRKRLVKGRRKIRDWFADRQGNVRIGEAFDYKDGMATVYHKPIGSKKYETLFEYNSQTEPSITVLGFGKDPQTLFYKAYKDDYLALYKLDLVSKESELVESDPDYDILGGLIYSTKLQDVIGISHSNTESGKILWDKKAAGFEKALDKALPDTYNTVISYNRDESRYILYSEGDGVPGMYMLGDRKAGSLDFIFSQYPAFDQTTFPEHERIAYTARDGTKIEGYLTKPNNAKEPLPTIIFPHGGPGARDYAGFDLWTTFFVNQGYVVLRPNFRGSLGYGYEFAQKQMQAWGLEMQDDLTDATQWLIDSKVTDPDRVCIVGGSYGGYAALMGAVKTPDLFKCAVSFAGVSSLPLVISKSRGFLHSKLVKNQIGKDRSDLKQRSPYYGTEKIKVPILLIHGTEDRIVDVKHSRMMADELEDEGKVFKYLELEEGDHHLSMQKNRHAAFAAMQSFLKQHLQE